VWRKNHAIHRKNLGSGATAPDSPGFWERLQFFDRRLDSLDDAAGGAGIVQGDMGVNHAK
jgi:hypothetical protein